MYMYRLHTLPALSLLTAQYLPYGVSQLPSSLDDLAPEIRPSRTNRIDKLFLGDP